MPVKVAQATVQPPISFRLDVMPVFMRAGCNTGSCHGAARGKDGFRLSLFGFDPEGDHFRLTREMVGRRINLAVPAESTLLEKATGAVPHTGGKRFEPTSELYQTLHGWLEAGAPNDDVAKLPTVVGVDLYPKQAVLDGKGSTQQMTVRARYSDGTDRDVTSLAVFLTNNDVSAAGHARRPGHRRRPRRGVRDGPVRDLHRRLAVHRAAQGPEVHLPDEPEANYIDKLVNDKLKKLRIAPSGLCDDETFLRRVYLDIVGLPPTVEEYNRFMTSTDPDKRSEAGSTSCSSARSSPRSGSASGPSCCRSAPTDTQRQLQGDVPLLQLAGRQALQEHADGRDGPGAARGQRRHVQEPGDQLLPDTNRDPAARPRTWPRSSWACASSAPSATTIRSTAGRRTTTTASPRSSPRSAASRARITARRSSSTRAAAR